MRAKKRPTPKPPKPDPNRCPTCGRWLIIGHPFGGPCAGAVSALTAQASLFPSPNK